MEGKTMRRVAAGVLVRVDSLSSSAAAAAASVRGTHVTSLGTEPQDETNER